MTISELTPHSLPSLLALGQRLWPDSTAQDYERVRDTAEQTAFIAWDGDTEARGFVIVSLRHDYVDGTTTSPVGYIEGIYVEPPHRRQGVGRHLITTAESWAREHGCTEMGSDVELENEVSQHFHAHRGFREVNRIVTFAKKLI